MTNSSENITEFHKDFSDFKDMVSAMNETVQIAAGKSASLEDSVDSEEDGVVAFNIPKTLRSTMPEVEDGHEFDDDDSGDSSVRKDFFNITPSRNVRLSVKLDPDSVSEERRAELNRIFM